MPVEKQNSYDYQNTVRDLSEAFKVVVTNTPVLSSIIEIDQEEATNTKHEWLDLVVSPLSWTIKAGNPYTAGDGVIKFTSNTGAKVGDILQFEKSTGARSTLTAKVTSVNANGIDVGISVYGGSTDEDLAAGTYVQLQSRPKNESTDPDPDNGREPSVSYNQTQIFDRTAKVSKTAQSVKMYGMTDPLGFQVEGQLQQLAYELCRSLYRSPRVMRSASEAGTMGGLLWFMEQAVGNKVLAGGGALSETFLNDALELGKVKGGMNLSTIIAHPVQARKISRFNRATGSALTLGIPQGSTTAGQYVNNFIGELGTLSRIVVDENMDKDKIMLIDPTKTKLKYLRGRRPQDMDATPSQASDYFARRILMEATLQIHNPESQIIISGLSM